ncbi:MAG: polyisoprenoid-binding protein [Calditrichaeota bacterium]|nr:MAG: polyisoprenoid-binding protein [Calditrichota bacterium]
MKIIRTFLLSAFVFASLQAMPLMEGAEYSIDKAHSNIGFKVTHMVLAKVRGEFKKYDIKLTYDEANIEKSSVEVTIEVASINTEEEKRDNHLRSPDFFAAEEFPSITFKSSAIKKEGEQLFAIGKLTIRNVTKEIKLPFEITGKIVDPWGNTRIGVEASLKINRKDYGVNWSKVMDNGGFVVSDDVLIEIQVEAIQKK